MKLGVFAALGVALAVGLWLTLQGAEAGDVRVPWDDPAAVTRGETLYSEYCASCHGSNLEGASDWRAPGPQGRMPAPPHDETGHTWHHADELLFSITKHGSEAVIGGGYESDMAGFGGILSDEDILATLAFIKSTWPDRVIEVHERINAEQ